MLPVIELSKFQKQPKGQSLPFAMCFVYAKTGNFVVKGMSRAVKKFVDNFALTTPCFYFFSFWKNGKSRGHWAGSRGIMIRHTPYDSWSLKPTKHLYVSIHTAEGYKIDFKRFRRMPHKWIPEFDIYVEPEK